MGRNFNWSDSLYSRNNQEFESFINYGGMRNDSLDEQELESFGNDYERAIVTSVPKTIDNSTFIDNNRKEFYDNLRTKQLDLKEIEMQRLKLLDEKGYSTEKLKEFRKQISKVSKIKADMLGEKLLVILKNQRGPITNLSPIEELVLDGANVNLKNIQGSDPGLIICARKNLYNVSPILIKAGADINIQNDFLSTATMWSARKGYLNILEDLLLLDADVNLHCSDGDTALISAVRHKQEESVRMLVKSNVILNATNNIGEDALSIARKEGYEEIANILSYLLEEENRKTEYTADEVKEELEMARIKLKSLFD